MIRCGAMGFSSSTSFSSWLPPTDELWDLDRLVPSDSAECTLHAHIAGAGTLVLAAANARLDAVQRIGSASAQRERHIASAAADIALQGNNGMHSCGDPEGLMGPSPPCRSAEVTKPLEPPHVPTNSAAPQQHHRDVRVSRAPTTVLTSGCSLRSAHVRGEL